MLEFVRFGRPTIYHRKSFKIFFVVFPRSFPIIGLSCLQLLDNYHWCLRNTIKVSGLRPAARHIDVIVRRRGNGCGDPFLDVTCTSATVAMPRRPSIPSRFFIVMTVGLSTVISDRQLNCTVLTFLPLCFASLPMPTHFINYVLRTLHMRVYELVSVSSCYWC